METEKLVIKHLSKRGELLDCINCPAGQVTVLRAEQESDLIPFRQALRGDVSGQKFSIYFNNSEFKPREHIHIGFGSWLHMESTVAEVLMQAGVSEGQISGLLISFGLAEYADKKISTLSADLERRAELLVAIYSNSKILIMEAPFEPIPQLWRDKFAELLLNDTILKRRVTLLTRLCYRPEGWVGNSAINRVQVGSSVKKTIGFGQDSAEFNKLVRELRDNISPDQQSAPPGPAFLHRPSDKLKSASKPGLDHIRQVLVPLLQSRRVLFYGGATATVCVAALAFYISSSTQQNIPAVATVPLSESASNFQVAVVDENLNLANKEPVNLAKNDPSLTESAKLETKSETVQVAVIAPPEQSTEQNKAEDLSPPPSKETSLDRYPMEIRKAIMEAFNEKDVDLGLSRIAYDPSKKPKLEEDDNPFRAISKLAPSKNTGPSDNSYSPPPGSSSQPDADFAQRQEEIRRRFLEALQRANSN